MSSALAVLLNTEAPCLLSRIRHSFRPLFPRSKRTRRASKRIFMISFLWSLPAPSLSLQRIHNVQSGLRQTIRSCQKPIKFHLIFFCSERRGTFILGLDIFGGTSAVTRQTGAAFSLHAWMEDPVEMQGTRRDAVSVENLALFLELIKARGLGLILRSSDVVI